MAIGRKPNDAREGASTLKEPGMINFMLLWLGQAISLIGSGMTCFAQSVWVYTDAGGTITHLSLLALSAALPGVLVSPLAGAVADRFNRRWVMIIADSIAALATLTLRTLIVTDLYKIWHIYLIVMVISIANQFQWPAYFASIAQMVPKKQLGFANGMIQIARSLGQVAAPFMAAAAVSLFKIQGVILFDFGTYLFSTITLLIIKIPKLERTREVVKGKYSLLKEARYGWDYLLSRPGLVGLLILFAGSNFMIGLAHILVMPLVLSLTNTMGLGTVMGLSSFGMLVGSIVMSLWGGPKKAVYGIIFFIMVQGLAVIAGGIYPSLTLVLLGAMAFYFSIPMVNGLSNLIWHKKVEPDIQGRVIAAAAMITASAPHITTVLSGPLADHVFEPMMAKGGLLAGSVGRIIGVGKGRGAALMFIVIGVICIGFALWGFMNPKVRHLEDDLPDIVKDEPDEKGKPGGHVMQTISSLEEI